MESSTAAGAYLEDPDPPYKEEIDDREPFAPSWYFEAPRHIAPDSIALISKPAADRWVWRHIRSPSRAGCPPF